MKLYRELASWWPLLSAPGDYAEEAAFYEGVLRGACSFPPRTLLELGSGGGNNAFHLKRNLRLTLVDPAEGMLEVSRVLNPECEHLPGDMRTVRLDREFDLVFIHDAIAYMTTVDDLRLALQTAWIHTRPGGAALFAPDFVRETFEPETDWGGEDEAGGGEVGEGEAEGRDREDEAGGQGAEGVGGDGSGGVGGSADSGGSGGGGSRRRFPRGMRFLEWSWDPDPEDTQYTVDYVCILRERDGSVTVEHDRHVEGLFPRGTWLQLIEEAGFVPERVPFTHSEVDRELEVFVGRKR